MGELWCRVRAIPPAEYTNVPKYLRNILIMIFAKETGGVLCRQDWLDGGSMQCVQRDFQVAASWPDRHYFFSAFRNLVRSVGAGTASESRPGMRSTAAQDTDVRSAS